MVNEDFHLNSNASKKGFNVKFTKLAAVFQKDLCKSWRMKYRVPQL
jgi:hypothetical protein